MTFPLIDVRATGQNIDRLMKQRHISIRTMQAFFGFDSPRAIYKWLRGEHLPSVDHLFALGKLLQVPLQDILIEQEEEHRDVLPVASWKLIHLLQRNLTNRCFLLQNFPAVQRPCRVYPA